MTAMTAMTNDVRSSEEPSQTKNVVDDTSIDPSNSKHGRINYVFNQYLEPELWSNMLHKHKTSTSLAYI